MRAYGLTHDEAMRLNYYELQVYLAHADYRDGIADAMKARDGIQNRAMADPKEVDKALRKIDMEIVEMQRRFYAKY